MITREARHSYTEKALERWLARLQARWEHFFDQETLKQGRRIYRNGRLQSVDLSEDTLTVSSLIPEGEAYCIVEWSRHGPQIRDSHNDRLLGRSIAVAGFYEIEELMAEHLPPIPAEPRKTDAKEATASESIIEEGGREEQAAEPPPKLLFFIEGEKLCFRVLPAEEEKNKSVTLGRREKLIRLSHMAHKNGFRYVGHAKVFEMRETERFIPFLKDALPSWKDSFSIHQSSDVGLLAAGQTEVKLGAKVRHLAKEQRLSLEWQSEHRGEPLDEHEIELLLKRRERPTFLPGKGLFRLDPKSIELTRQFEGQGNLHLKSVPLYSFVSLFQDYASAFDLSKEVSSWLHQLRNPDPDRILRLPSFLRPYQKEGVAHLLHLCQNGCHPLLADEMGLGKTVQILTLLSEQKARKSSLVVCPASVVPVWMKEVERFFPKIKVQILRSDNQWKKGNSKCLWIASYTQLRRHRHRLEDIEFQFAILDEAQQIKNPDAKITRACYSIAARHRVALTGTPIENSQMDIWSIFRFLMPDLLGSRRSFTEALQADKEQWIRKVRAQTSPFILRRTKKKVARELPDKIETDLICSLGDTQRRIYSKIAQTISKEYREGFKDLRGGRQLHFLTAITRLRQTCCDLSLLPEEFLQEAGLRNPDLPLSETSGKLDTLLSHLREILANTRKVVIFSQFVSLLDRTRELLEESFPKAELYTLTGSTRERKEPVDSFQKTRKTAIMLASLKAGGTGITLHAADYVFLLDPWWNPAAENQAIDRVHRIGQDKTVFVYRLVAQSTIEENIQKLKEGKIALFEDVMASSRPLEEISKYFDSLESLLLAQKEF